MDFHGPCSDDPTAHYREAANCFGNQTSRIFPEEFLNLYFELKLSSICEDLKHWVETDDPTMKLIWQSGFPDLFLKGNIPYASFAITMYIIITSNRPPKTKLMSENILSKAFVEPFVKGFERNQWKKWTDWAYSWDSKTIAPGGAMIWPIWEISMLYDGGDYNDSDHNISVCVPPKSWFFAAYSWYVLDIYCLGEIYPPNFPAQVRWSNAAKT